MATKIQHQEVSLTRDEVDRGRAQVAAELDSAQASVDAAAYKAALKQEPEHRQALITAQHRLQALRGELDGLDAVGREVARVERRAGQDAALAEIADLEAQALHAIHAVGPAHQKASQALHAFAEAFRALNETKEAARTLVIRANPGAVRSSGGLELEGAIVAVREQILREFGESLSLSGVLDRTEAQITANVAWSVDAARKTILAGIQERRDQLKTVMAAG